MKIYSITITSYPTKLRCASLVRLFISGCITLGLPTGGRCSTWMVGIFEAPLICVRRVPRGTCGRPDPNTTIAEPVSCSISGSGLVLISAGTVSTISTS